MFLADSHSRCATACVRAFWVFRPEGQQQPWDVLLKNLNCHWGRGGSVKLFYFICHKWPPPRSRRGSRRLPTKQHGPAPGPSSTFPFAPQPLVKTPPKQALSNFPFHRNTAPSKELQNACSCLETAFHKSPTS